ncbi:PREDICTED: uncharacterized protein C9orf66 homolog [Chinchilla lanigera]|uniref:uncharacterized protein C9orf66 homolog n=1 Tax=Chinchilla lanigera TaxID=34839 RepID=UPI0006979F3B|nr:PREDICTED: uncharacterized protein C9orf66 homolog [Chinchilla lanigera]
MASGTSISDFSLILPINAPNKLRPPPLHNPAGGAGETGLLSSAGSCAGEGARAAEDDREGRQPWERRGRARRTGSQRSRAAARGAAPAWPCRAGAWAAARSVGTQSGGSGRRRAAAAHAEPDASLSCQPRRETSAFPPSALKSPGGGPSLAAAAGAATRPAWHAGGGGRPACGHGAGRPSGDSADGALGPGTWPQAERSAGAGRKLHLAGAAGCQGMWAGGAARASDRAAQRW